MVTTNGGITDIGVAGGGTVSSARRDSPSQSSQDSFGDTLKSQMGGAAGSPGSNPHNASNNPASNAAGNAQHADNNNNNSNEAHAASGDSAKTGSDDGTRKSAGKKKDNGNGGSADASPHNATVAASATAANTVAASAADGAGASPGRGSGIEGIAGGKNLPLAAGLPGTDPTANAGANSLTAANLLQPLGENAVASTAATADSQNNSPDAVGGNGSSGDNSLLKELQALATGAAGKDGKSDSGTTGQDTSPDALLKLIGEAGQKGGPPSSLSSSTASSPVAASGPMSSSQASAPASAAAPTQLAVAVPVNQSGWDHAVAAHVVWLAQEGIQQASIHLHPKNMGPIEVHIALHKDDASVAFVAHHEVTREALQSAMPKLREMMQQSGLNLAQSDVSHQSFGQHQQANSQGQPGGRHGAMSGSALDGIGASPMTGEIMLHGSVALGAVDYYA